MRTFVMQFEPEDTGHIGMGFRTIEMDRGTHGISGAEMAADVWFRNPYRVPYCSSGNSEFQCAEMLRGCHI